MRDGILTMSQRAFLPPAPEPEGTIRTNDVLGAPSAETVLVDRMAQALWLSKRAVMLQHVTFNHNLPACDDPKQLALYIRYQTTNERAFHKSLNDLVKLRAEKRRQEIGFESQHRLQAEHMRREATENRKQERHRLDMLLAPHHGGRTANPSVCVSGATGPVFQSRWRDVSATV